MSGPGAFPLLVACVPESLEVGLLEVDRLLDPAQPTRLRQERIFPVFGLSRLNVRTDLDSCLVHT